jgi:hypothetical protein
VVPLRLTYPSYAIAYHEIYQSELPLFVSVDSIFHSVFATHDELLAALEARRLAPLLSDLVRRLHEALPAAASAYPPEVAGDLDLYLSVARALLTGRHASGSAEARALVDKAMKADALATVEMLGRARMIDFTTYRPRGHYAKDRALARYFRGAMWLSRLELNLVSRSSRSSHPGIAPDPSETPREATMAVALADLAERSGAMADLGLLDAAWGAFAGPREDVPLAKIAELRRTAGIGAITLPEAANRLRAAIGDGFRRTARLHYMPQGSTELPAITTLLGPRVVADATATRPLVHGETPDRYDLGVADLAYAFGHDRARRYLAADLARFPILAGQLDVARAIVTKKQAGGGLYGAWLDAVRALAQDPPGALPSFMGTEAFRDLRVNSFVAAYGQLKHNNVLLAGQPYDEGACAVPDGFVEPAPAVYRALADYAERGREALAALDPGDALGGGAYFRRLGKVARVLAAISDAELSGRPLSAEALSFLSMVVEIHGVDIGTGFTTTYNGWYFDLFLTRPHETTASPPGNPEHASMASAAFVADFYASTNTGTVAYAGAREPALGIFVVDTGGAPRLVVGPVARAYEHHAPMDRRLTDEDAARLADVSAPWAASYAVLAPKEPRVAVAVENVADGFVDEVKDHRSSPLHVHLDTAGPLGSVTVERLDHHRRAVASLTRAVGPGRTTFAFPSIRQGVLAGTRATEMLSIRVGAFHGWVDLLGEALPKTFGGMTPPPQ